MKRWLIGGIVLVAIAGGVYWLTGTSRSKAAAPFRMGAVDRGLVRVVVTATGTASAVTTVQVGSQVSGTIREIAVDFNSPVKKGQVIARIDPTFLQAAVAEAEANLERSHATLRQAERDLERVKDLYDQNLAAKADYDNALTALEQAKAGVRQTEAQLQRTHVNLTYSVITSPIDGVVVSRNVDVGQTVAASLSAPTLFTIAQDLRQMQVETNIDEADIGNLREGMDAEFTVDSYPDELFRGVIQQVRYAAKQDQNVVTYPVILRVDNPDLKLRPGMTANVTVVTAQRDSVLRVPATALRFRPPEGVAAGNRSGSEAGRNRQGTTSAPDHSGKREGETDRSRNGKNAAQVWVKGPDGTPESRRVRLGLNDGSFVEILGGELNAGDSVIVGMVGISSANVRTVPGFGGPPSGRPR